MFAAAVVQAAPVAFEIEATLAKVQRLTDDVLCRGASVIVSPLGELLAGPEVTGEAILRADIDIGRIAEGKYDFDAVGHYARLVSGTVKDLVIGSGIEFEARGDHELLGVPGRWPTFAVTGDARERTLGSAAELAPLVPRLDDRLVRTIARRAPSVARAAIRAARPHRTPE